MKVERLAVDSLHHDPSNVRKHDERNVKAIAASLQRFGQQKPIVVDGEGIVRAGNGTLEAAKSLGWADIEAVRTDLESAEAVAYAIADNRTAELAEWDEEGLALQLDALDADLLGASGFDQGEVAALMDKVERESLAEEKAQAMQLEPPKEYVVIVCENAEEWEEVRARLGMGRVRRGGYKRGSEFDSEGDERVVEAARVLERLA
jgi:ParB-like chromosome segregation protein Spo0J